MIVRNLLQVEVLLKVYMDYKNRTHFTPICMADGDYSVNEWFIYA